MIPILLLAFVVTPFIAGTWLYINFPDRAKNARFIEEVRNGR